VARLRPLLLVLDPFVRLHAIDENVSGEVAPLLGFLRSLQRDHRTAVALVHHARKGAGHQRGGQALRGSSELHAWGDSNLYLRRSGQNLYLAIEHRAAPGIDSLQLTLKVNPPALALELVDKAPARPCLQAPSRCERIKQILSEAGAPLTQRQLRDIARMRASLVSDALARSTIPLRSTRSTCRARVLKNLALPCMPARLRNVSATLGAAPKWQWRCGFYPGSRPGECTNGTADTLEIARADFEAAWRVFLAKRTDADFQAWRDQQAWTRGEISPVR
jgi:hypothetical protein